jgi:TRAP-type mannitol/chloroaromatic compound transport system substrate-binding protein
MTNKVKERTKGRLVIEPFVNEALVPSTEIYQAVERGMLQMGQASGAYLINKMPIMAFAAGLPFSFQEVWEAIYFHTHLGLEQMLRDASAKFGVMYYTEKIYPTEMALRVPLTTFEGFKGLKFRSSGILQKMFTSVGAAASYIPGPEIYPALATGVVDGAHWGAVQGSLQMGFFDVCKYTMKPPLNVAGTDCWYVNEKAFKKLPADIQMILHQILEEHMFLRSNQYIYQEQMALVKAQKELGVKVTGLPPEEQTKLTRAAMKEWDEVGKRDADCAKALQIMKDFLASLGYL